MGTLGALFFFFQCNEALRLIKDRKHATTVFSSEMLRMLASSSSKSPRSDRELKVWVKAQHGYAAVNLLDIEKIAAQCMSLMSCHLHKCEQNALKRTVWTKTILYFNEKAASIYGYLNPDAPILQKNSKQNIETKQT